MSSDIQKLKTRANIQKLYLIFTHKYNQNDSFRKYEIKGSTGNVYTVNIQNKPTCTCPDHIQRKRRCKHIYFVLIKIMKVSHDYEDKNEFTDGELKTMFMNVPKITDNLMVDNVELTKYLKYVEKMSNASYPLEMKKIKEGDLCPVCLDELFDTNESLVHCKYSCGFGMHKLCFDVYNENVDGVVKCLFCHHEWNKNKTVDKYINISK
jgi:hypothetical protein